MSSMRNAVTRRPHKERSQPQSREKWGVLEKHKDYTLRARDYNLKKAKLAQLSQKARDRHPDEFAFGMLSARTVRQGKHGQGDMTNRLSHDTVKLLKTQDAGYLRTVVGRGRRELERLEQVVEVERVLEDGGKGKKTVFVNGEEAKRGKKRKASELDHGDSANDGDGSGADVDGDNTVELAASGDDRVARLKPKKTLKAEKQEKMDLRRERRKRKQLRERREAKLLALKKRQKEVMAAAEQLELQRAKMNRTVGGVNKAGVRWKIRERKK